MTSTSDARIVTGFGGEDILDIALSVVDTISPLEVFIVESIIVIKFEIGTSIPEGTVTVISPVVKSGGFVILNVELSESVSDNFTVLLGRLERNATLLVVKMVLVTNEL